MTAEPEQLIKALAAVGRGFDSGAPVPLATRTDGVVVRVGGVVVKAHPAGTDPASLAARLGIAAGLAGVLLAPVRQPGGEWLTRVADRLVTVWPAGEPVDPDDPDAAPWERAATLLARLHRSGAGPSTAPDDVVAGAPGRVARALARLHRAPDHPGTPAVRAAYRSLPRWAYGAGAAPAGRPRALVHGDWHLGQLVRLPDRGWLLVDVDDLGYGDPVWDLARPAAWYATGLLAPDSWHRFLDAYRRAGGPAVAADGDPFQPPGSELDTVARALVVQMAALALAAAARERRDLDELDQVLVDTSRRIAAG